MRTCPYPPSGESQALRLLAELRIPCRFYPDHLQSAGAPSTRSSVRSIQAPLHIAWEELPMEESSRQVGFTTLLISLHQMFRPAAKNLK